jgi:hypothetical protein
MTKKNVVQVLRDGKVIDQDEFTDELEAISCYDDAEGYFNIFNVKNVIIKMTLIYGEVETRKGYDPKEDDAEWQRERAMEAGMLHGIDAYNEVMGY